MVPVGALGLLLCVQLCGGERWGGGSRGAGTPPPQPQAGLNTLLAAGTGELRLVDGGGRCAGRVEVKHDGEWGSVCVYDFDWPARWGTVVCRQLGCGPLARASPYTPFGQGTGRIWLHPIFCQGSETMLRDCPHFGWGQHFCDHERDVGVTCAGEVGRLAVLGHPPCAGASPGRAEAVPVPRCRGGGAEAGGWRRSLRREGRGEAAGPLGLGGR